MKPVHYLHAAVLLMLFTIVSTQANTLTFIASLDSLGNINYSWSSANNWYVGIPGLPGQFLPAGGLPGPGDSAIVTTDSDAGGNNIKLASVQLGGASAVTVTGGNFIVGAVQMAGGCNFVNASIEVDNSMTTGAGVACELNGCQLTIQSGASWTFSGGVDLTSTVIENIGQIIMTDDTSLDAFDGGSGPSSIMNQPDAVFSSFGDPNVGVLGADLIFDNAGIVRCDSGILFFNGGILWTNSTTNLSKFRATISTATLSISGLSTVPAGKTFVFSGPGTNLITGDTATVNGTLQVGIVDPTTQIIDVGTFNCLAGIGGTGLVHVVASNGFTSTFNWGGAAFGTILSVPTVNIDAGAQINSVNTPGESSQLSGCVLNNSGTFFWAGGGNLVIDAGSVLNNLGGALFDAASNGMFLSENGTNNVFNNAGTFRKSGGTGDTIFDSNPQPFFNNTGLLDVQMGRVVLQGGANSGQFNVAPGAQIRFYGAPYVLAPGANFTGLGTIGLGGGNPVLWINTPVTLGALLMDGGGATLDGACDLTISDSFAWSGGTLQGGGAVNVSPGASLVITGGTLHRTLNNAGIATLATSLPGGNGAAFNNQSGGACALTAAAGFSFDGAGAMPFFNNAGTVSNATGSYPMLSVRFTNSGTVQIQSNRITFADGYTQTAGATTVASGATLELNGSTALIAGGAFGGVGLVDGALTNLAIVHPGFSPGILTINSPYSGNIYTQGGSGGLAIDIGGLVAGSQFSQLAVDGPASLNGMLILNLINGFMPALGDSFSIETFNSETGGFAGVTGNHLGNGLVLVPQYSVTNVALIAANDLNLSGPAQHPNGFGFSFLTTTGFSYVVQYADNLNPPVPWQTLTNVSGNGLSALILDPDPSVTGRFYRVLFQ